MRLDGFPGYLPFICEQNIDQKIVLLQRINFNDKQISSFVYAFEGEIYVNLRTSILGSLD